MKYITILILSFMAFNLVESHKPWDCKLGCTDQFGFCGTQNWQGENDCELQMQNCFTCSKTTDNQTYCATYTECHAHDDDWIDVVTGLVCFIILCSIVITILMKRRRKALEEAVMQANFQRQQFVQKEHAVINTNSSSQEQQFYQSPPQ